MGKGVFCISIDAELLWGRHKNHQPFIKDAEKARFIIQEILSLFKKYQIPATWALVGELFNPGDPLWHGPDIISEIKAAANQELACHSFSHLDFSQISDRKAEKEIENCSKLGVKFKSFVFPYNKIGHLKILKKYGFACYRGEEKFCFGQLADFFLLLPPTVGRPIKTSSGLINLPASMYFVSARGLRRFIPPTWRFLKAKKGLNAAVAKKMIFHLWLHEIDLARNTEKMFWELEEIIKYAVNLQKAGKLEIKSMSQVVI